MAGLPPTVGKPIAETPVPPAATPRLERIRRLPPAHSPAAAAPDPSVVAVAEVTSAAEAAATLAVVADMAADTAN